MTRAEWAFRRQRHNARQRGIEWLLTFEQWWAIWEASGKWGKRGKNSDSYVMGRFGDTGAYAVGNVAIIPFVENIRQGNSKHGLPLGVGFVKDGLYVAKRVVNGKRVYLGCFPTPELAHAAYLAAVPEMEQAA